MCIYLSVDIFQIFLILLPFLGTIFGSSLIYFVKNKKTKIFMFFQALSVGVMIGVSVFSLLIPSLNLIENRRIYYLIFALLILSVAAIINFLDILLKKIKISIKYRSSLLLLFAIAMHNIPEGFIVGVFALNPVYSAIYLSFAIAVQNIPEASVVATSFYKENKNKNKAFLFALSSGIVEPISAMIALFVGKINDTISLYLHIITFGAMLFVSYECFKDMENKKDLNLINYIGLFIGIIIMYLLEN